MGTPFNFIEPFRIIEWLFEGGRQHRMNDSGHAPLDCARYLRQRRGMNFGAGAFLRRGRGVCFCGLPDALVFALSALAIASASHAAFTFPGKPACCFPFPGFFVSTNFRHAAFG